MKQTQKELYDQTTRKQETEQTSQSLKKDSENLQSQLHKSKEEITLLETAKNMAEKKN